MFFLFTQKATQQVHYRRGKRGNVAGGHASRLSMRTVRVRREGPRAVAYLRRVHLHIATWRAMGGGWIADLATEGRPSCPTETFLTRVGQFWHRNTSRIFGDFAGNTLLCDTWDAITETILPVWSNILSSVRIYMCCGEMGWIRQCRLLIDRVLPRE